MSGDLNAEFDRALEDLVHDARFAGIEFVSHGTRRVAGATALTVTIDREGGIDFHSCERVAAAIASRLGEVDASYTLAVESAGLNRPLTKPGDYERFSGKAVKIVTTLAIDAQKTHRGTLRGLRGTNVILETAKGELPLPLATIKAANLEYDARADLARDKKERRRHG